MSNTVLTTKVFAYKGFYLRILYTQNTDGTYNLEGQTSPEIKWEPFELRPTHSIVNIPLIALAANVNLLQQVLKLDINDYYDRI